MPVQYEKIKAWPIPTVEQAYTRRDTMLYALGLGFGADPLDEKQLRFVYEKDLLALPTLPAVLGHPGPWFKETGLDWMKIVAGEFRLRVLGPVPTEGTAVTRTQVHDLIDNGPGRGALLYTKVAISDKASGRPIAEIMKTTFCRGDGGFGGPTGPKLPIHALPAGRPPDMVCDLPTCPQAALIYRLSGDYMPLHAEPAIAKKAGFPMPILHGLLTYGVACHALLKTYCDYDPARLKALDARFSSPVFPGETIRTEFWRDGAIVSFQCRVAGRDAIVLKNGRAEIG